jgi:hypothetical protein
MGKKGSDKENSLLLTIMPMSHGQFKLSAVTLSLVALRISVPTSIAPPSPPPPSCCTEFADRGRFGRRIFSILSLVERGVLLACLLACLCYGTFFFPWKSAKNWSCLELLCPRRRRIRMKNAFFLVWSLGTGLLHSVFAFRFITCAFSSVVFRNPGRSGSLWEEIVVLV